MKKTLIIIATLSTLASANSEIKINKTPLFNISSDIIKIISTQFYTGYTVFIISTQFYTGYTDGRYISKDKTNRAQ